VGEEPTKLALTPFYYRKENEFYVLRCACFQLGQSLCISVVGCHQLVFVNAASLKVFLSSTNASLFDIQGGFNIRLKKILGFLKVVL
jgi:hypothetical protein